MIVTKCMLGHEVTSHKVSTYDGDVIKILSWRLMVGSYTGSSCYFRYRSSQLIRCTKVLAQTTGTEFLSPAHYACAVYYACAEVNFKEKRS